MTPTLGLLTPDGFSPLHLAAEAGSAPIITALLAAGLGVDSLTANGSTPLMVAAQHNRAAAVTALLRAGAALDVTNGNGDTALCVAEDCGAEDAEERLRAARPRPAGQGLSSQALAQAELQRGASRGPINTPSTTCGYCGEKEANTKLRSCSACMVARYCGPACSKAAWPSHKAACKLRQAERAAQSSRVYDVAS